MRIDGHRNAWSSRDTEEQHRWSAVKKDFPLYEPFWRMHVFTLRDERGRIRADVDERLELMAQEHYKCFISVSMAQSRDPSRPERAFSSLQNAANRARGVIQLFNSVQETCAPNAKPIDYEPFQDLAKTIATYRNFIHEDVVGLIEDKEHHRYIPLPEKIAQYRRWSRFHGADLKDFVLLEDYIGRMYTDLCQLLDQRWHLMLDQSKAILESAEYQTLLPPLKPMAPMQPIVLCSNVQIW
jgi:hypothetical protein